MGLWQLNTEFLVLRSTETQCRQGLQGGLVLDESYMSLLEKTVTAHPPQKPTTKWLKQLRDPLWPLMERVLQQFWDENCSSGAEPRHSGPQLAYQ